MRENAIEVQDLSKMFKLYPSQGKRFLDYLTLGKCNFYQEFWALRDISFVVPKGCAFGILGQNGSGKSTLLSILAGVLEPSNGNFQVHGKVSAILELGAGFHPEFTGRANANMYGSIMGLSKEEIDERMPDIIQFSELGDFIDQPLRTYSSGMYARLAFSVAVNVNADILIVDEALAVGDALFQHRCFRKIHEMKESGKTILYVGHDTEAVRGLCDHAMILDGGRILDIGDSATISNKYLALIAEREQKYYEANLQEYGEKPDENWETVYNFIDHLAEAEKKMQTPESIREVRIDVKNTPRRTIFAHPPSELCYRVHVNPGSVLSFAIGIYPSAYDFIVHGVRFTVRIDDDEVFCRTLEPKKNKSDQGWHNQMISLSEYEGREVSVRFITEGSGRDVSNCWGGWGWPSLFHPISSIITQNSDGSKIRTGNRKIEIIEAKICDENGGLISSIESGDYFYINIIIKANETIDKSITVGTIVRNKFVTITGTNTLWRKCNINSLKKNEQIKIIFKYHGILNTGVYFITPGVALTDNNSNELERLDRFEDELPLIVNSKIIFGGFVNLSEEIMIHR
jgi:ABC-type polysaccharide/polyol phosphate transport system ATPase subunit